MKYIDWTFLFLLLQTLALLTPGRTFAQQADASATVNIVVAVRLQPVRQPVAASQLCVEGKPTLNPWGAAARIDCLAPKQDKAGASAPLPKEASSDKPGNRPGPLQVVVSF